MDSPTDIEALRTALARERVRAAGVEAELTLARAKAADDAATIAHQRLEIAKLRREIYGSRSERASRFLELEELEANVTEDEISAERAAAKTTGAAAFTRNRPARQPFPAHLPRERVVVPGAHRVRMPRRRAPEEAWRGDRRDAGGDPAPMEGDPTRAREDDVPGLREHQ